MVDRPSFRTPNAPLARRLSPTPVRVVPDAPVTRLTIEVRSVSVLVLVLAVCAACCLGFGFVLQQNAAERAPLGDFLSPACCSTWCGCRAGWPAWA